MKSWNLVCHRALVHIAVTGKGGQVYLDHACKGLWPMERLRLWQCVAEASLPMMIQEAGRAGSYQGLP